MLSFLDAHQPAELLIVDDGSVDGTAEVAERYLSAHCHFEWRVLRVPVNRGKGHAVRQGLLAARAPVAPVQRRRPVDANHRTTEARGFDLRLGTAIWRLDRARSTDA